MENSIYLIFSIFVGLMIIALYIFFIFRRQHVHKEKKRFWERKLRDVIRAEKMKEEDLTLIKKVQTEGIFLQSKILRIDSLKQWIQRSGLSIGPVLFCSISLGLGICVGLFLYKVLDAPYYLSSVISLVVAFSIPWVLVSYLTYRRQEKFIQSFPTALDMIRRALKAGHSTDKAIKMVADQSTGSIKEIFNFIVDKSNLGEPLEEVLTEASNRIGVGDFRLLAIVLVIQRETGGGLAEIVETFSNVIRARQVVRKKVKAITSEAKAGAIVITSLPFALLALITVSSPRYLDPLFYTADGHKLLIIGGVMMATGVAVIFRMVYRDYY